MADSQPLQGGYIKGSLPWTPAPIVHMIAGDFLIQACHINLHDDATHTITSNYDEVTCVECRVGWMQYERDEYKASCIEAERKAEVAERDKEIAVETAGKEVAKNLDLMAENRGLRTTLEHLREQKERQRNTIRTLQSRLEKYEDDDGQPITPALFARVTSSVCHWQGEGNEVTLCGERKINDVVASSNPAVLVSCEKCQEILTNQPAQPEWIQHDSPIHRQFPLCLKQRPSDHKRCSMPFNHGPGVSGAFTNHFYNLTLLDTELEIIGRRDVL